MEVFFLFSCKLLLFEYIPGIIGVAIVICFFLSPAFHSILSLICIFYFLLYFVFNELYKFLK